MPDHTNYGATPTRDLANISAPDLPLLRMEIVVGPKPILGHAVLSASLAVNTFGGSDVPFGESALILLSHAAKDTLLQHVMLRLGLGLRESGNQRRGDKVQKAANQDGSLSPLVLRHSSCTIGFIVGVQDLSDLHAQITPLAMIKREIWQDASNHVFHLVLFIGRLVIGIGRQFRHGRGIVA